MNLKKKVSKSIALALSIIMLSNPIINVSYAMEKEEGLENNINTYNNEEVEYVSTESRNTWASNMPNTAISPVVFALVGLVGYNIYHIYKVSKGTAKEIDDAWAKIPKKIKDPDGSVGIKKFTKRLRNGMRQDPKTGYVLDPDKGGHKGSKWKLKKNPEQKGREASLDSEGRVVGK